MTMSPAYTRCSIGTTSGSSSSVEGWYNHFSIDGIAATATHCLT